MAVVAREYENGNGNALKSWRFPIGNQVLAQASRVRTFTLIFVDGTTRLKVDTAPLILGHRQS